MHPIDNTECWYRGKGYWSDVCDADWSDWKWQMKNRLTKKEDVQRYLNLSEEELVGFEISGEKLLVSITPHFFNLINPNDVHCPIRKQVIPTGSEAVFSPNEFSDPVGEEGSSPVPGVVHRYPDRVLSWLPIGVLLTADTVPEADWFLTPTAMGLGRTLRKA